MPALKLARVLRRESALREHVRDAAGAIARPHRPMIAREQMMRIGDSLDLDEATKAGREQEHRWDYLVSLPDRSKLVAIEPHPASDGEVEGVIRKKKNATALLREELTPGVRVEHWHWVSSRDGFSRNGPARRTLDQNGIKFHSKLIRRLD